MFRGSERSYGNTTRTPMTNDPAGRLTSIYPGDRDDRVNFEAIMHMETLSDDWHERDDRRLSLNRRWKRNHESLYLGSGIKNNCNETLTKAQQNTRVELIAFDPGDAWSGVSEILPKFQIFFPGQHAPRSLYIIRAFGTDSPLVQSPITWCLMFSYRKSKSKPRQNGWWYGVWMKKKFKHQRNYTKRGLRDSWIWNKIIVGILNHWDLEYQDSNDCFTIIRSRCYNIIPEIDNKFGLDAIDVRGKNNTKMLAPRLGAIRT